MPTLTVYHLQSHIPDTSFVAHFGREGIGFEETGEMWPSDSLFAALVAQSTVLEGCDPLSGVPPQFAQAFTGNTPPLTHSSLFPRVGSLVLLPRPALPIDIAAEHIPNSSGKSFKYLRYLSPALLQCVCGKKTITTKPVVLQGGQVWISAEEATTLPEPWSKRTHETPAQWQARIATLPIWARQQVPRVTVDRVSNASAFYEVGRVVFAPGCGLTLLVQYHHNHEQWQKDLLGLLEVLGESGIGGRRSSGYGSFRIEQGADLHFPEYGPHGHVMLLSRYLPRYEELAALQDPNASYQLVQVGGWLFSPGTASQARQRITLVAEGSVLVPQGGQSLLGRIVDVRPDYHQQPKPHAYYGRGFGTVHNVYRSGMALTVPTAA